MASFSIKRIKAGLKSFLARRRNTKEEVRTERAGIKGFFTHWYQLIKQVTQKFLAHLGRGSRSESISRWAAFVILIVAAFGIWQLGLNPGENRVNLWWKAKQEPTDAAIDEALDVTESAEVTPEELVEVKPDLTSQQVENPVQPATAFNIPQIIDFSEMVWPITGEVSHGFGWYRDPKTNNWRFNPGVLIVPDTPSVQIRASLSGAVEGISTSGNGYVVEVAHAEGWRSEYQGLTEVSVIPGQMVEAGDALGKLTLAEHRPGLLFTLVRGDKPVDALDYLYTP